MKEIWKDVKGYEGLYQVSNLGRVQALQRYVLYKHKKRMFGKKLLKLILKSNGYYAVSLYKNGQRKQKLVHRLVAECFCKREYGDNIVDHINTVTTDNRSINLKWTTVKGNVNNPISAKRRVESIRRIFCGRIGCKHPKSKQVFQLTLDGKIVKIWDCVSDAVRECGFDSGSITRCCNGKYSHHKGYKWRYVI